MNTSSPPPQSLAQRRQALARANQVRRQRADDKLLLKRRQLDARVLLAAPPEHWQAARVAELLLAIPGVGHTKVERMLRRQSISPVKTLGGMTQAQRTRLAEELKRFYG